ncbi:4Fe-4S ferredoxin-type, iron-sulphur binding domain [Syntrophomonas zehnderi OL-4]|uniref:4Fe-4S ferredoxin-type, iron-sulphur binding domain n=1 Tax=Syntrophomonas zehnderi OL-4 TaxID=690567 RepID=A0A0E3W3C1_9FIRM|nr:4Fe-4S dicluster domain-containing protein [Syntrophomonas zehnderi]CFX70964.1 4Fe-4S ferredoxin-type, iron-sulphur binding domain [Syntrophomonas zehnderi OL-4]
MNRRDFLKVIAAAGIGGIVVMEGLDDFRVEAAEMNKDSNALQAKHWGMVIDISKFQKPEDIQRVANACHQYHNVPDIKDPKHEVKWIWKEDFEHAFAEMESKYLSEKIKTMNFPVLCNHCEEPMCVRVCPTKATFKRPDGIVVMDYHRCIGCRYCMAGCPYGARSFNFIDPRPHIGMMNHDYPTRAIGVVEKCTMCVERLNKGLKPICVEVSRGGIIFGDLNDPNSEVRKVLRSNFAIRRKAELGTGPSVYYVIGGDEEGA